MPRSIILATLASLSLFSAAASRESAALTSLAERVAPGASSRFIFNRTDSDSIYFSLENAGDGCIRVSGNDNISLAVGLNHYFRNYLNQQVSWVSPTVSLPEILPPVDGVDSHSTVMPWRYYLNYCTHSYSMAFWDWERWQQEIDWMALHGINLPLAATGMEAVWRETLRDLGYPEEKIKEFIAGPGYQAWWLMNNLEGWGGPVDDKWIDRNRDLQIAILDRMRSLDMHPVLPGYSGMVPHDAHEILGLDVADPGLWCGYPRPAFLQPTDSAFSRIADTYYKELSKMYGISSHYSMDPFHEGGNTSGVDLKASGKAILDAMQNVNPDAVWVIQGWQGNPRRELIDSLPSGSLLILDLWAESAPQWQTGLYGNHDRIQCLLLNYGGNSGLHGKMRHTVNEYKRSAAPDASASQLKGVGATMEGIENNEVMYTLIYDLPWYPEIYSTPEGVDSWLDNYAESRYGLSSGIDSLKHAWHLLERSIYACPDASRQQGTTESVFCARPAIGVKSASSWAYGERYWDPQDVKRAAELFSISGADREANRNYIHDLTDITRQSIADHGRAVLDSVMSAVDRRDPQSLRRYGEQFLNLILVQDSLLAAHPEFNVDSWISQARKVAEDCGADPDLNEWNARTQITVWGNRQAADYGGLHDYANKEWSGLLREFYYPRWSLWISKMAEALDNNLDPEEVSIDWYTVEEPWTKIVTR